MFSRVRPSVMERTQPNAHCASAIIGGATSVFWSQEKRTTSSKHMHPLTIADERRIDWRRRELRPRAASSIALDDAETRRVPVMGQRGRASASVKTYFARQLIHQVGAGSGKGGHTR